jgi:mannose-6-phosphate isomerase-like protein (cupin superfamily)
MTDSAPASNPAEIHEIRPWGSFTVLEDDPLRKVKRLLVHPGHRLSLQLHHQREEHWIVTHGCGDVTVGEQTWAVSAGTYVHIPRQQRHRLANTGTTPLEVIEVQLGDYFGEDDIVRFADDYHRLDEATR